MSAIVCERTARQRHRCSRCRLPIEPGTRYQEWKIPPAGGIGYQSWKTERVHRTYGDCISQPCSWRCGRDPDRAPGDLCCLCEPGAAARLAG